MKKLINIILILFCVTSLFWAQGTVENSSVEANRNTALRCLKLAESCLIGGDWNNALNQAQLGLSYDDSISDLLYVKAAAEINLKKSKQEVINLIELAFTKNNWVGYTVKGARILYADLLSDVGRYDKSMLVLDEDPFILSADAEFIRIKNLYRKGTAESINNARLRVNSSRRIYPKDLRFPELFFMFEIMYQNEAQRIGIDYEIPEIVNTIAQSYISNLPDYKGDKLAIELMATFFANDNDRNRLVKAIDAKGDNQNSLLALAGLNVGLYSDQQAFDLFFSKADNSIALGMLELFALKINDDNVKKQFVEKMLNFTGTILIDKNLDLQPEMIVHYDIGRPDTISYDYNNDDVVDLYCTCDFGAPKYVYLNNKKINLYYSSFPNVSKISYVDEEYVYNFINDDFQISVIEMNVNNILNSYGLNFYVPVVSEEIVIPDKKQLMALTSSIELPIKERTNSKVVYTGFEGKLIFADFYENDIKYAYCDFSKGFPVTRYVDQDNNGSFETKEVYNISENDKDFITDEERDFVNRIFNERAFKDSIYLQKVMLDLNSNTFNEFSEQYLGLGGKITIWDNDDNGIPDSQYIKYPCENNQELKEDSIFFDKEGNPYIIINFIENVPVKMSINDSEVMIFAGNSDKFYWIENEGSINDEKFILENTEKQLTNGLIKIVQIEDNRITVIKVNDNIFCKIISPTTVNLDLIEK